MPKKKYPQGLVTPSTEQSLDRKPEALSTRTTKYGDVVGFIGSNNSFAWMGIPYAEPPIGDLRWRAPHPPKPWRTLRRALEVGAPSCQPPYFGQASQEQPLPYTGSEDCLYLNIWSPAISLPDIAAAKSRLPVMLWVHGGSNIRGQGGTYDGGLLATSQQVIVVTINYRLGVFGWFTHPSLRNAESSPEDRSGNYGTLDIISALQWVRDNIAAFGGDPNRVTIFGGSAGGQNIYSLLVSPKADRLFHRAIVQSGGTATTKVSEAENYTDDNLPGNQNSSSEVLISLLLADELGFDHNTAKQYLASKTDLEIAAYLRGKTYLDFSKAYQRIREQRGCSVSLDPIPQLFCDGVVLPINGIPEAFSNGNYYKVPIILGSNNDEFTILLPIFAAASSLFSFDEEDHRLKIDDKRRYYLMAEYLTALLRARSVDAVADILCRQQPQSIYCYLFTWNELAPAPWLDNLLLGATHALEVPFVFGHRNLGPEFLSIPLIEQKSFDGFDYLSRVIMSYWAEFSYTGRPERGRSEELPPWHSWDTSDCARNFILLDLESRDGLSMSSQNFITEAILYRLKTDPRFENIYDRNSFFFDLTKIAAAFALLDATDYAPFPDG